MKRLTMTFLVLAVFIAAGMQNIRGQTGAGAKLEAEITKVLRGYYDAFSRRDIAATLSAWADGGFIWQDSYSTTNALKESLPAYLQSPNAANTKDTYEMEGLKILPVTNDTAIANYIVISTTIQNGKTDVQRDVTSNFLVRRDGRWQIVVDHTSSLPKPLEPTASGMPVGWIRTPANSSGGYLVSVDRNNKRGDGASASIKFNCADDSGFGSIGQMIAADNYLGKRVRLTGWLKTENADSAVLWMRIDGNRRTLGFDNMLNRPVTGTTDWKQFEVVLDVPVEAINVVIGSFIQGKGQLWVDDLKLEVVGAGARSTNQLSPEQSRLDNPNRTGKKSDIKQGVNLGFEDGVIP
ncbi:MAG: nuclear transport factor 2 family protein [Pyrinomonadaceae bacterium]